MCPVAEAFYAEELSLPLFYDLTDADQDRVVEALRNILEG
jgi:dTDP-4-amino-4,6-dideoxygalactose transaminase